MSESRNQVEGSPRLRLRVDPVLYSVFTRKRPRIIICRRHGRPGRYFWSMGVRRKKNFYFLVNVRFKWLREEFEIRKLCYGCLLFVTWTHSSFTIRCADNLNDWCILLSYFGSLCFRQIQTMWTFVILQCEVVGLHISEQCFLSLKYNNIPSNLDS